MSLFCRHCPDGGRQSPSYANGAQRTDCVKCGRQMVEAPWALTEAGLREFFERTREGVADLPEHAVALFIGQAMVRAFGLGRAAYTLHGFFERDLQGEPEAELLDSGNYGLFQALKLLRLVDEGALDPVKGEEAQMRLRDLTAKAIRLHADWRDFWAWLE